MRMQFDPGEQTRRRRHRLRRGTKILLAGLGVYGAIAYLVLPWAWRHYERRRVPHPAWPEAPRCTVTHNDIPGDPLNLALIGTAEQLAAAMVAAGWDPVDPTSLRTGMRIAEDVLINRPYPDAPVSNLFVWGRRQDLAFEQPLGVSPRHRHHVRFWRSPAVDHRARHLWLGAATFDRGVGFSHDTWQITHHIDPDIDAERDKVIADLRQAERLADLHYAPGIGATQHGRNGGGDPYFTDGRMATGILASEPAAATLPATPSGWEAP